MFLFILLVIFYIPTYFRDHWPREMIFLGLCTSCSWRDADVEGSEKSLCRLSDITQEFSICHVVSPKLLAWWLLLKHAVHVEMSVNILAVPTDPTVSAGIHRSQHTHNNYF